MAKLNVADPGLKLATSHGMAELPCLAGADVGPSHFPSNTITQVIACANSHVKGIHPI